MNIEHVLAAILIAPLVIFLWLFLAVIAYQLIKEVFFD